MIFSKIDWVFVNTIWLNKMPDYSATFLNEGINDHCPAKLERINGNRRSRQFKYCNVWSSHPKFMEIVEAIWEVPVSKCKMF